MSAQATQRDALDVLPARITDRIWPEPNSGCWLWSGCTGAGGYGQVRYGGRPVLVHRLTFEIVHGQIPVGMCICHHCDNPPCCNPAHLFLGTHGDNSADRDRKGRTPRGERSGAAILTDAQVVAMREEVRAGARVRDVARKYGVRWRHTYAVVSGEVWGHVPGRVAFQRARGERNGIAKLREADIPLILQLRRAGKTHGEIAKEFGVVATTITRVLTGEQWRHARESENEWSARLVKDSGQSNGRRV